MQSFDQGNQGQDPLKVIRLSYKETKLEKEPTWPYLPGSPAPLAGLADWRCQSSSTSRQEDSARVAAAREHTLATSCLPASPPRWPRRLWRRHALPSASPTLVHAHPLPWISPSPSDRARSSPPFTVAAATGTTSPPLHAHELRLLALKLFTKPRIAGSPTTASPTSSSTSGVQDRRRPCGCTNTSPEPLSTPDESP